MIAICPNIYREQACVASCPQSGWSWEQGKIPGVAAFCDGVTEKQFRDTSVRISQLVSDICYYIHYTVPGRRVCIVVILAG